MLQRHNIKVNDTITLENKEVRIVKAIDKNHALEPIIVWESKRFSGGCIPDMWMRWKMTGKDEYLFL